RTTYDGVLLQKPFSPRWRGLVNGSLALFKDRLKLDATAQFVGEQRIPNLEGKLEHHTATTAPAFTKILGQVTYQTKRFEVYVGGENLTGFMQHQPIIGADDPFGPNFDAAMIWGPTMGPMVYTGFRFKILNH
ncbi:MAG TPA: TonB-dependent receptor, partial [Chitinophagales bacterium]|nr:TonB-dependent receptor [Chitinophagales bacterium]